MSNAAFRARNVTQNGAWSNFSDGGFDADSGDVIEVQLEASPALDVWLTEFSCVDRSNGRSVPVFDPSTGIASVPTAAVQLTLPADEHGTWAIQCQVNGGPQGPDGRPDPAFTKERYIAVRTPELGLRHMLAAETIQYLAAGGWAVAIQELLDAVDAFAAAAGTYTAGNGLTESPATVFNVGADVDGSISVSANAIKVGVLATDAQHGNRGGGALHADVVPGGASGFMSGTQATKLAGIGAGATVITVTATAPLVSSGGASPDISLSFTGAASPANVATSASGGASTVPARSDHAHALPFATVQSVLAGATGALTFNGQNLSAIGDLTVGGNLVVQGTTTTVNSTEVKVADRLVTWNASTGIVPVPVAIAGFIIDRGSADGVTKRDMPGMLWDESNSRFALAYNTAGDQSTIGSLATFLAGAVTARTDGIATTRTNAVTAHNATAATAGVTRQFSGAFSRKGSAWVSGASRAMEVRDVLETRANGALDWGFYYNAGSGESEAFRFTTSTSGQFVTAVQSYNFAFGNAVFHDGSNAGLFMNGADSALHIKNRLGKGLWYSDEDLEIQTGGANARMYFAANGDHITVSAKELNVKQLASTPVDIPFASTIQIDWDAGLVQRITLTGNITSLTNKNVRPGAICVLILTQDATGGRTVTFEPGHFEHATALGAALGGTAITRTSYTFVGKDATRLTPLAAPYANIVIP